MVVGHKPPLGAAYSPDHKDPKGLFVYGLRSVAQALLGPYGDAFRGFIACGTPGHMPGLAQDHVVPIYLEESPEGEVSAYPVGIRTCGSPWICPVCAPGLARERAEVLSRALARLVAMGYSVAHVVLTMRHTRADSLADLRGLLSEVWRSLVSHRRVKALWRGLGWYRAIEITFGKNGWHPHIHLALAVPPGRDPWTLEGPLWEAWQHSVEAHGWVAVREAYAFSVATTEADAQEIGRYLEKWDLGLEVAGGPLKGEGSGLTPFQLLAGAFGAWLEGDPALEGVFPLGEDHPLMVEGAPLILREFCGHGKRLLKKVGITPEEAAWRWVEYAEATKGWKRTFANRPMTLLLRQIEEELAAEKGEFRLLGRVYLSRSVYRWLVLSGRLAYLLHYAETFRSLRVACELLGLVEGEEWWESVEGRSPPGEEGMDQVEGGVPA